MNINFRVKKSLAARLAVLILGLLLLGLGAVWLIHTINGPTTGTISQPAANSYVGNGPSPALTKTYNGKYLSFNYPNRYSPVNTPLTGQLIEVFGLYSNDHSNISVTLSLQTESLVNDSGLIYRRQTPDKYRQIMSKPGVVMFESSTNGYEKDAFITHNDLVASLVLTAPSQSAIDNDFDIIFNSLSWH